MGAAEEAEEEGHDGVGDLLGAGGVDVDEAEAEVGGEGGVDGAVGGAETDDELPGAETALGGAGEVSEGVEEDGGGGLDPTVGEASEGDVLHGGDAGEGVLLEGAVVDAVEGHDQGQVRGWAAVEHCHPRGGGVPHPHRHRPSFSLLFPLPCQGQQSAISNQQSAVRSQQSAAAHHRTRCLCVTHHRHLSLPLLLFHFILML